MLDSYINPEATVKVILPVFVNTSRLEFGDQLLFYKKPEATEEKKRKVVEEVDAIAEWAKQRADERMTNKKRK